MAIGIHGVDRPTASAIAFVEVPAEIPPWLDGIHFLPVARTRIRHHGLPIWEERKAERVPQAVGID